MNIDAPILRKALEHITAHPEEWNQSRWAQRTRCGTACCLAGTIVAQQGYNFDFQLVDPITDYATKDGGTSEYIPRAAAAELLGRPVFDHTEADDEYLRVAGLFMASNSLRDLWCRASRLTDGEIEIPEQFL